MTVLTGRNITLVLLIGATIVLNACGSTDKSKSVTISTQPEPQGKIVKSPIDSREYKSIVLDNQLEVMLVSDPSIEKSAAALSVAVGSFQEPKEFGGLAHYLEHMLFLGTKSFPTVGDYSEFVSRNGGSQNAYTQLDHTNYMVAVKNDAYDEALSRFSGFFYEAILEESYADKERNAVHSEWTMKSPNDGVILEQLNGSTLNPEHPISQFNWSNLDSLVDKENTEVIEIFKKVLGCNALNEEAESLVAIATILTMVEKKQDVFKEITEDYIKTAFAKLNSDTKPQWGTMTAQHMVEHLEMSYRIASGEKQDFDVATPEESLDRSQLSDYLKLKYGSNVEGAAALGGMELVIDAYVGFQKQLYVPAN